MLNQRIWGVCEQSHKDPVSAFTATGPGAASRTAIVGVFRLDRIVAAVVTSQAIVHATILLLWY